MRAFLPTFLLCLTACGGGAARCVTGATATCNCSATSMGIQICGSDGALGACMCGPVMDAGRSDAATAADGATTDGPCGAAGDADGDGHRSIACGGDDCNDADPNAYPGNHEICDAAGHDDDCNPATLGPDLDADGFAATTCCNTQPTGTLLCGGDCDDTRATVNPTAPEVCDGIDDNCNGMIDEGIVSSTFYPDCDHDGYGAMGSSGMGMTGCSMPTTPPPSCAGGGWSAFNSDCDDMNAMVHPGATEICNGIDDDCNPATGDPMVDCYPDADHDGFTAFGASATPMCSCPSGWQPVTAPSGDRCDMDINAHPGVMGYFTVPNACGNYDYDSDGMETFDPSMMLGSDNVFPNNTVGIGAPQADCPDHTLSPTSSCVSFGGSCDSATFMWCAQGSTGCTAFGTHTPFAAHCGETHSTEACPGGTRGPSSCYKCNLPTSMSGSITIRCH